MSLTMDRAPKRKIHGLWWLPGVPGNRWTGTLTLRSGKFPRLKVIVPTGFFKLPKSAEIGVLFGRDLSDRPITLFKSLAPASQAGVFGTQLTFSPGYVVLGGEFASMEEFKVNEIEVAMQHLFEWSCMSGFAHDPPSGKAPSSVVIEHRLPTEHAVEISPGLQLRLRPRRVVSTAIRRYKIEEDVVATFVWQSAVPFKNALESVHSLRHLLHFSLIRPVFPISLHAQINGVGNQLEEHFIPDKFEIFSSFLKKYPAPEFDPTRWIFRLPDIQESLRRFLSDWFRYVTQYEESINCYFTTIYHQLPHSLEHLSLTQALDAYHGVKFRSHSKGGFEAKVREIIEPKMPHLKGLVEDPGDFAKSVVHNRNYYTHHNPKWLTDGRIVSGANLYRMNEVLKYVFQMSVLEDIGIDKNRFNRLRQRMAVSVVEL